MGAKIIPPDAGLLAALNADKVLQQTTWDSLAAEYEEVSRRFHGYFKVGQEHHHQNALLHQRRYLDLLKMPWSGQVLDVGNDKPFLSYFLQRFNPETNFETISYGIPETPFRLHVVDVEREKFPFEDSSFDQIIFTEVIEHLWRNPSFCVHQMNRVLKPGGRLYVTTPNPCDRHSLVCVLWQANPNQRSGYYSTLESGHLHLWTVADVKLLLEQHGFSITTATTRDLYGHTRPDENIEGVIRKFSPHRDLMNEAVVVDAKKDVSVAGPAYPTQIFPDGCPLKVEGAILGLFEDYQNKKTS